jgi:hypothetical protein
VQCETGSGKYQDQQQDQQNQTHVTILSNTSLWKRLPAARSRRLTATQPLRPDLLSGSRTPVHSLNWTPRHSRSHRRLLPAVSSSSYAA